MKTLLLLLLIAAGGYTYYQQQNETSIEGVWRVNLAQMGERAKANGMSEAQIQQMNSLYVGGIMDINGQRMQMKLADQPNETINLPYTVVEKDGQCTSIRSENQLIKHCLEEGFLVTYDPSTPIVAVHERI